LQLSSLSSPKDDGDKINKNHHHHHRSEEEEEGENGRKTKSIKRVRK
jgi:hypothetical protein